MKLETFFKTSVLALAITFGAKEIEAQTIPDSTKNEIQNVKVVEHSDQNMPSGFDRHFIEGYVDGKKETVASLFYFDETTKAYFLSNDKHSDLFYPNIDYEKIYKLMETKGRELVIAFAGAYKSPSGNIEGVAIENGISVGEENFSKWSGFVYITPDGSIELHRCRDDAKGVFDEASAKQLVERAKNEGGSVFQQIPAMWNGEIKLISSNTQKYEFRAICESYDGKRFVLNCTKKITMNDFLNMAHRLKDMNGKPLVKNLMLEDTGDYSFGVFFDKDKKENIMIDENFQNEKGYTNTVVITKEKK